MKIVKRFEDYISEGTVRSMSPDKMRAINLKQEAIRKNSLLNDMREKIGITDNNANDYVEYCYNIIMFLIRAHMYEKGYSSSGVGAHEAEVAYARILKFSNKDLHILDQLRYFRNGILYYGKRFDAEYADKILVFKERIMKKSLHKKPKRASE